jgi:16S rRNA (cytidine1402-2'-O)-methyltransferase
VPLVFVPTPLGNLRDITLRATDVLRDCTALVAEDTRIARKLLSALGLPGKMLLPYHEHNARSAAPAILERARAELVAVITDAGTPGISDPGSDLIGQARAQGIPVEVLPGPTAAIGAAVLSGFDLRRFVFEGFAPRTASSRRAAFERSFALGIPSVWYESPQRIRAALMDAGSVDPEARVFLVREYTKRFEQQIVGTPGEVAERLPDPVRGEIAFVVEPSRKARRAADTEELDAAIDELLDEGLAVSSVAKALSERGLAPRAEAYARASGRKRARRESPAEQR